MDTLEKIVSLCKRRGFVFPGSEIYGGLAGTYDYGPLGIELKNNIRDLWWKFFVRSRRDMYGLDSAILMNQKVWQASGHARGFSDPLVECQQCKRRFRADQLEDKTKCAECGGSLGEARQFYMMLEIHIGAADDTASVSYLRPETAQGMFVNFKNVIDAFHPRLPFGIAQVGKAFRNEIAPRDFIFRLRELEQMEVEYFVRAEEWESAFEMWRKAMHEWIAKIGIAKEAVHELEVPETDRAHYSKRTIDFEYDFPFGRKELYGLAYRADYDLRNHSAASGVDLSYLDEETKEKIIPYVIEPSLGIDRTILAVLCGAYTEDEMGGEKRIVLKFNPKIAPIKVAVFPLLANKPDLVQKAREVYQKLEAGSWKLEAAIAWDDNGNIGKRYRRQDEIGTPWCVTIDFQTLEDNTVTVRDRDSGQQERVYERDLEKYFSEKLA